MQRGTDGPSDGACEHQLYECKCVFIKPKVCINYRNTSFTLAKQALLSDITFKTSLDNKEMKVYSKSLTLDVIYLFIYLFNTC